MNIAGYSCWSGESALRAMLGSTIPRFDVPRYSHHHTYDEAPQPPYRLFVYALMLVIAGAFAGFIWNWYAGPAESDLRPPAVVYDSGAPQPGDESVELIAPELALPVEASAPIEGAAEAAERAPDESLAETSPVAAPRVVGDGPFLVQLAALQSEAGVDGAWARVSSRAPDLFARARLDVERADLGPRGIYYRVRAGYFTDRPNAVSFCERVRAIGQDCIVVAR